MGPVLTALLGAAIAPIVIGSSGASTLRETHAADAATEQAAVVVAGAQAVQERAHERLGQTDALRAEGTAAPAERQAIDDARRIVLAERVVLDIVGRVLGR